MKPIFLEDESILVFTDATVHTVSSFCEEVIRDNPAFFDTKGGVLISELEKVRLLKALIDGFANNNPLKRFRGDVYAELHPLARLFSLMKKGPVEAPGAEQFDVFRQMMEKAGKYDADDMISWVITAFEQNPSLLSKYKERLQYATGIENRLTQLLEAKIEMPEMDLSAIMQQIEKLDVPPEKIAIIGYSPESRNSLNILHYIAAEQEIPYSGEDLLFKIMHNARFHIPSLEAAKICRQAADQKTTIRAYLQQPRIPSLFSTGPHENALHLSQLLEKWIQLPLPELLEAIPQENALNILKEEIRRNPDLTLPALMESVDLVRRLPNNQQAGQRFEHIFLLKAEKYQLLAPEIEKMDPLFIDPLLKGFAISSTLLSNYLRCPLAFFYQQLIKVPMGRKESLAFGSAAHFALEKLFLKMQAADAFPPKEVFLQDFNEYMFSNRGSFTTEAFERRMEYGHRILNSYYDRYIHEWNPIVSIERNIRNISVNGVPVKGKIDKLEFDGSRVNIVDYKTGDYEKTKRDWKKFSPPEEKQPAGGDYWRQGVFYKILLDNYKQKNWQVVSTEFDFIEPGANGEYFKEKMHITPADITTVTQQITESWERIQQRNFYTGCGKPYCEWCNFVKDNQLQVALKEEEAE